MEKSITDELIMAYVDGELEEDERRLIEEAIKDDEHLREKVRMFKESSQMLQGVFDAPIREEVPQQLIRLIEGSEKRNVAPGWWERLTRSVGRFFGFQAPVPAFAVTAACILIAGLVALIYFKSGPSQNNGTGPIALSQFADFQEGISKTQSGASFLIKEAKVKVTPVLTFKDKEFPYCREFEVIPVGSDRSMEVPAGTGIACLSQRNRWQVITYVSIPKIKKKGVTQNGYELADGENPVDALVEKRRVGTPLSRDEELEKIRSGWK